MRPFSKKSYMYAKYNLTPQQKFLRNFIVEKGGFAHFTRLLNKKKGNKLARQDMWNAVYLNKTIPITLCIQLSKLFPNDLPLKRLTLIEL